MIIISLVTEGARAAEAPPPFRLCVYDEAAILRHSKLAANMALRFQQIRRDAQVKFENESLTLNADERAFAGLRTSLPPGVAKAKSEEILRRRSRLKADGERINRDLEALDGELTASVRRLAEPVLRHIEVARGCSVLAPKSLFLRVNDASIDITGAVLERMNASLAIKPSGR